MPKAPFGSLLLGFCLLLPLLASAQELKPYEALSIDPELDNWSSAEQHQNYLAPRVFINRNPESDQFFAALNKYMEAEKSKKRELFNVHPQRGCFFKGSFVYADSHDQVMFGPRRGHKITLAEVRKYTFDLLVNDSNLSYEISIPDGAKLVKKHMPFRTFVFTVDLPLQPQTQAAVVEVRAGILDYREHMAQTWFNKSFNQLQANQQDHLNALLNLKIEFVDSYPLPPGYYQNNEGKE